MRPITRNRLLIGILLISPGILLADNWPKFRGPSGQGVCSDAGFPITWSLTQNLVWKTAIPGIGWSSPIIWGDRIFITSTTKDGVSCHVICIERANGRIAWDKEVFTQKPTRKEGKNSYATPTPVTDGHRVYAFFSSGGGVALDFAGNIVWTNREFPFYSRHGLGASPILYKDLLIMPFDGSSTGADEKVGWQKPWDQAYIIAFNTSDGKVRWRATRGMSPIGSRKSTGNLRLRRFFLFWSPSWGAVAHDTGVASASLAATFMHQRRRPHQGIYWAEYVLSLWRSPPAGRRRSIAYPELSRWRFMKTLSGRSTHPARVHSRAKAARCRRQRHAWNSGKPDPCLAAPVHLADLRLLRL